MSEPSFSTSKTIVLREVRWGGGHYTILIDGVEWYSSPRPPGWFFWVGLFQQVVGRYNYEVVHEVIE